MSELAVVAIQQEQLELVRSFAARSYPRESCGLLVGTRDAGRTLITGVEPAPNVASQPAERFEVAAELTLSVSRRAWERGEDLVGIFHSHPDGDPLPSDVDRQSPWTDLRHVITAVCRGTAGETRAWRIERGAAAEEALIVLDATETR